MLSFARKPQVEASMSGLGGEAEIASGAWTNASLADADIIIVEEGEAHNLMLRHPGKKFIVVQQPAHATLAAIMESYGTCVFRLVNRTALQQNNFSGNGEICGVFQGGLGLYPQRPPGRSKQLHLAPSAAQPIQWWHFLSCPLPASPQSWTYQDLHNALDTGWHAQIGVPIVRGKVCEEFAGG